MGRGKGGTRGRKGGEERRASTPPHTLLAATPVVSIQRDRSLKLSERAEAGPPACTTHGQDGPWRMRTCL